MTTQVLVLIWLCVKFSVTNNIAGALASYIVANHVFDCYATVVVLRMFYLVHWLWINYQILFCRHEDECIKDVIKGTWNKTIEYFDLLYLYYFEYDIFLIIDNDLKFNAYNLNKKYNNNIECIICYDKFEEQEQILLNCGHRYCSDCFYENENVDDKIFISIYNRCPFCNKYYTSFNKWKYNYNYQHIMME